jgi:predicted secreted hydrolase
MKSRALLAMVSCFAFLCEGQPKTVQYEIAQPGYQYQFPRDHFNHEGFQTEWWYYTGNLKASDGHRFGFELTFFRQGVDRPAPDPSVWSVRDLYFAHLALSDLSGGEFYHTERFNRAGPGLAGATLEQLRVWNGNWQVRWEGNRQMLQAVADQYVLQFELEPEKPLVSHGQNGVSQKAAGAGHASHYISLTRLRTTGKIQLQGKEYAVEGTSWMDHEFFTDALGSDEVGWDWLSVQLDDHSDVMLYRLRHKDGSADPYSSGTYVDGGGKATHLQLADFQMVPLGEEWKSAASGASYPINWNVEIPSLGLAFSVRTSLKTQEIAGKKKDSASYWEGAVEISGQRKGNAVHGVGYLELTGYDRPLPLGGAMR